MKRGNECGKMAHRKGKMEYLRTWQNKALLIAILIFSISSCARKSDEEFILESALEISKRIESSGSRNATFGLVALQYAELGRYDKAIEITEDIADSSMKEFSYSWISERLAKDGEFTKALQTADLIEDDWAKSDALSDIAVAFASDGQYEMALMLSDSITDGFLRTWSLVEIGKLLLEEEKRDDALAIIEKAFDFAISIEDQEGKDNSLGAVSCGYARMGENKKAQAIVNMVNSDWKRAGTLENIADVHFESGDTAKALISLEKAYELGMKMGGEPEYDRQFFISGLSIKFVKAGDFEKGIEITRTLDRETSEVGNLVWIAFRLEDKGKSYDVEALLNEALEIVQEIEEPYVKSLALSILGREYARAKEYQEANEFLAEALNAAEEIEKSYQRVMALAAVARGYVGTGEYERALEICGELNPFNQAMVLSDLAQHQKEGEEKLSREERRMIREMVEIEKNPDK